MLKKKRISGRILAFLMVFAMLFAMLPITAIAQIEGETNIATLGKISVPHSNGGVSTNINDGTISRSSSPGTTWNTWGATQGTAANPFYVTLTWDEPYVLTGSSILWWVYTDSGVQWPRAATVEYFDMTSGEWRELAPIGVEGKGTHNQGSSGWVFNDTWNDLSFDDKVVTDKIRLSVVANKNSGTSPGFGINEWEVYGYKNPAETDLVALDLNLMNLAANVNLPSEGTAEGSTITWSSSNPDVLSDTGVVTRPEIGQADATGTITATATNGEYTATRVFDFSVLSKKSVEDTVAHDLSVLDLGDLSAVVSNLNFPKIGDWGSELVWDTADSPYLWSDGSVIRPTLGSEDAVITLTVTATYEGQSDTRTFEVTIPAFAESKAIVSVEEVNVNCPEGTVPELPNDLKVTYTDGSSDLRRIRWSNDATGTQNEQASYAVGTEYQVSGYVTGDTTGSNGFTVTANVKVVAEQAVIPSKDPVAQTISLNDVTITGDNRLTENRDAAVEFLKNVNVDQMLYNYRATFGVDTQGAARPTGWDSVGTKLKGHGTGHYLSAMAQAYGSTGDETLLANMKEMVDVMRELQEMTFVQHPTEDRFFEARDVAPTDDDVSSMSGYMADWGNNPEEFGYGYINAIPPEHPILIERYAAYNNDGNGVWAPYYSIHKQLAGLIDIYNYTGYEPALQVAKDLGLWIWNRLNYRTFWGEAGDKSKPGNLTAMWSLYIAGEYGGVNESLARLYDMTDDDRFLEAATFFDNKTFFDPLSVNKDSIRTLHANQHIPQITGALWIYKGSGDKQYYEIAENFWNYNRGRYSYSIGGVGTGEMYRNPYAQATNIAGSNCETCCAYNLLKLTKDLNGYDPENAEYMDYYERLLYNQVIGSIRAGSNRNAITYHYPIGSNQSKGFDSAGSVPSTCCSGTGSENHVKYQESTYFTSTDNNTLYVGLYMPTEANWEAKGVKIKQDCLFPAETSTITVEGSGTFAMKLRVPSWATEDFDITLNGVSIADSFEPGTYASTGIREWNTGDEIVVTMPYDIHIDSTPDKRDGNIVGSVMYGPLVMTTAGEDDFIELTLDTYLEDESLIKLNGPKDVTGTSNLYTMTINGREFVPHYYATTGFSTYFYINYQGDGNSDLKTALFEAIQNAKSFNENDDFTVESRVQLGKAIAEAIGEYQDSTASKEDIDDQIQKLIDSIAKLEGVGAVDKSALEEAVNNAKTKAEADYTWDSFAVLQEAIAKGEEILDTSDATQGAVDIQIYLINQAIENLVDASSVDKSALLAALNDAATKKEADWTVKSWNAFAAAKDAAQKVYDNTERVASQKDVDAATEALNKTINKLHPAHLCDEYDDLVALIAEAKEYKSVGYTPESFAALKEAITFAEGRLAYIIEGSGTWDMKTGAMQTLRDAINGLKNVGGNDPINLAELITYEGTGNDLTFTNGSILDSKKASGGNYNSWNNLSAVNDGFIPETSNTPNNQAWATWGYTSFPIWIEYDFGDTYEISSTSVFWNDNDTSLDSSGNVGDGGIKVPANWTLEYFDYDEEAWKEVTLLSGQTYGTEIDMMNDVMFEKVVTDKVRIVIPTANTPTEVGGGGFPGICEWQVWGTPVTVELTNLAELITYGGTGNDLTFTNGSILDSKKASGGNYNSWNNLSAVNDGFIPETSNTPNNQAWATWGYTSFPIWLEYNFGTKCEISSTSVFWNDNDTSLDSSGNVGDGGIKVPANWTLEYFDYDEDAWKEVTLLSGQTYGTEIDMMNDVMFEKIVTDKVRIVIPTANTPTEVGGGGFPGICEWQVWGTPIEDGGEEIFFVLGNAYDKDDNIDINLKDVLTIQKFVAFINEPTQIQALAADVDGDGEITLKDALLVQKYVAKFKIDYPVGQMVSVIV